jgi:DNA-binding response OmpR family regulator
MPQDRLLEGEDPQTIYPHDARHWIAVYREMIDFKDQLLSRVEGQLCRLPKAAWTDVADNDIGLIQNQLDRYQRRLEFWYSRQWELEGLAVDPESRVITYRERSVRLTKRELELLTMLVSHSPQFITPRQLLVQAWHDSRLPEETLRTYIVRLRAKVAQLGIAAEIVNRPRRGYALVFAERQPRRPGGLRPD